MQAPTASQPTTERLVFVALPKPGENMRPDLIDAAYKDVNEVLRGQYSGCTHQELSTSYAGRSIVLMSMQEFNRQHDDALRTEPEEIAAEDWQRALEVMPPMKWQTLGGVESFRMTEFYSGSITTIYAKCDGRHWKFMDDADMPTEQVVAKVLTASVLKRNAAGPVISKIQYKAARKLLRENGKSALRWMTPEVREAMEQVIAMGEATDQLTERAGVIDYCKREDWACTPRHTASRAVLGRFEDQRRKVA